MSFVFFVIYLAANFAWIFLLVVGGTSGLMRRNPHRGVIVTAISAVLALALTAWAVDRGPGEDDQFGGECATSRMGERCY